MSKFGSTLKDNIASVSKQFPAALCNDIDGDEDIKKKDYALTYLNPMQLLCLNLNPRRLGVVAGRGCGKTTISSLRWYNCYSTMPRGSGVFVGASYKQLWTKTLPSLCESLEKLKKVSEFRDYVRGKPDPRWGWDKPFAVPRVWENVVSFPNGGVTYLISTNVISAANGMNLCYSLTSETRFINWLTYCSSVRLALRGYPVDHPGFRRWENPMYLSEMFESDAGIIRKQQEWEAEEEDQTDDVNDQICDMLAQLKYCEIYDKQHGTSTAWTLAHHPEYCKQLQYLRCKSRMFMRFSSLHNIEILGEDFIKARKRDMPELMFRVQVLGQKATIDKSTRFYPNFDIDIHGYDPVGSHETEAIYNKYQSKFKGIIDIGGCTKKVEYETPDLDELSLLGNNSTLDVDCHDGKDDCLYITHDYNSNVNTVVTSQLYKMDGVDSCAILSSMYVVNPKMLEDLMEDWCKYYAPHKAHCRKVVLGYDATAKQGQSYASRVSLDNQYAFFNVIKRVLVHHGWDVVLVDMGSPMKHEIKFEFINACFAGKEKFFPRINRSRNDYLIASLEQARTMTKFGQVHKDKSAEKKTTGLGISEEDELGSNNYTDMSDAFDSMLRLVNRFHNSLGRGSFGSNAVRAWMPD